MYCCISSLVILDLFQQNSEDHVKNDPGAKTSDLSIQATNACKFGIISRMKVGPFEIFRLTGSESCGYDHTACRKGRWMSRMRGEGGVVEADGALENQPQRGEKSM